MPEPSEYIGPSGFAHLHSHSIYSALDGVATIDEYAEKCVERGWSGMALTEHGHMGSLPDFYFKFKEHGLKAIPGCFLPLQPVLTDSGVVDIEDLVDGHRLLTHKNGFQPVLNLQSRAFKGDMVVLKSWGVEDITCTSEHPFLVREVKRRKIKKGVWEDDITVGWYKAGELFREKYHRTYDTKKSKNRDNKRRYRFYLCVPRPNGSGIDNVPVDSNCFLENHDLTFEGDIIRSVKYHGKYRNEYSVNLPRKLELDEELLWIMGLWLAEGTEKNGLHFHLSSDEFHFCERITEYFAQFGIKTSHAFRNGDGEKTPREALDVSVYSVYFGRLFVNLFGEYFDRKSIPSDWLLGLSRDQSKWLLDGLFDGDAKVCKDQSYLKLCNRTLVWQARVLLSAIGQYSAVSEIPNNNSDNIGYCIRRRESGHFYYDLDDDFIYLPVYDIDKLEYDGLVYNAQVKDDNSYNVGVACHNCEIYFNDFEPQRQKLVEQGIKMKSQAWRVENFELATRINRNRHLTVLCKNEIGLHNLLKLTTEAYDDGLFGAGSRKMNRIWFDKLCKYREGLIILSGCLNGPVAHELRYKQLVDKEGNIIVETTRKERFIAAANYVKKFKDVFGEDYYIELQMPGIEDDHEVFWDLVGLADFFKLKLVLANDSHYIQRKDFQIQKIMMATAQGTTVDSPDLFHVNSDEQFFKTRAELWAYFNNNRYCEKVSGSQFEAMCDTTLEIVDKCEKVELDGNPKFPRITDDATKLTEIVFKALRTKGLDKIDRKFIIDGREVTYTTQATIELTRFISKGFASYFLITQDLIMYGKSRGWIFGPRGSAGGSLVCYLLGLSSIDPLKWDLSFDRFLSEARGGYRLNASMPKPVST